MNPPIKVSVSTDNLRSCSLKIHASDSSDPFVIKVPSDGNVYQGLHAIREELQTFLNDLLASHGVLAPPPPSEIPPPVDTTALEAEVAALAAQKAAIEAHEASVARAKELEAEKAKLEAALAASKPATDFEETATEEKPPVAP